MRMPNGYGSIVKLSGKRRKPFMVRITSDKHWDVVREEWVYQRMVLGYYHDKKEAVKALADYNDSPFSLFDNSATFEELWSDWKEKNYPNLSKSAQTSRNTGFKYCAPLHKLKIRDINIDMLETVIDSCEKSSATKKVIKAVMSSVFQIALRKNLVSRDITTDIKIQNSEPTYQRIPYTNKEIAILWKHSSEWSVAVILILLYSGMRVNEFLKNDLCNVNLEKRTIYVPKELAKNNQSIRIVPIHDMIYPLIERFYNTAIAHDKTKIAVNNNGTVITYNNFVSRNLPKINDMTGTIHKLHDTRHTFVTAAKHLNLDELTTQKIIGHKPDSIMKEVYTHISIEDMYIEINKLTY